MYILVLIEIPRNYTLQSIKKHGTNSHGNCTVWAKYLHSVCCLIQKKASNVRESSGTI